MIESRDRTTYSHSSHKCSARGSNQHWPERYQDATRQGTVKLGCNYATWRWVHYLHGSSSSGELICLAQGQHGAASATVIDPMTSRFGFPCFTTTSPRSLFILSSGERKTAVTQFLKTFQERQKTFSFCSLQSN